MLTYQLKKAPGVPLYEALYRCIRQDILSGKLVPGTKLPSKRALAENLEISKITVENAYNQLLSEGFIRSREKVGFFVEAVEAGLPQTQLLLAQESTPTDEKLDLTGGGTEGFPFATWMRLQREVMLDLGERLLLPMPNRGVEDLRIAIARHLADFRGMQVDPGCILVGAGTDFLYNILIQLLGREYVYAIEEPGYGKIRNIYAAGGVRVQSAAMDSQGVRPDALADARVLHISPSHHFPTGLVTPVNRRLELIGWAKENGGWIIEDDYDSEFRFDAHPMPAMQTLDRQGRVIYLNSFSKALAPSIRISYMVLPPGLMERFRKELGFYSCTVPSFEQHTLARFISRGYFEKHINRMRRFYKNRRNRVISLLRESSFADKITILEQNAGLHFILKVDTRLSDGELVEKLSRAGIRIRALSDYYHAPEGKDLHCLVVNYTSVQEDRLEKIIKNL